MNQCTGREGRWNSGHSGAGLLLARPTVPYYCPRHVPRHYGRRGRVRRGVNCGVMLNGMYEGSDVVRVIDLVKCEVRDVVYIFTKNYTDKEVLNPNFIDEVNNAFRAIRPYFNYMSDVLTTDLNGVSII